MAHVIFVIAVCDTPVCPDVAGRRIRQTSSGRTYISATPQGIGRNPGFKGGLASK